MTDPLSDQPPPSEEYLHAALARAEAARPTEDWANDRATLIFYPGHNVNGQWEDAAVLYDDCDVCAVVHGNLAYGCDADAYGALFAESPTTIAALARECLRLRELLAEAAGALRGFAEYAKARDQYPGWAACPDDSLLALSDGYGGGSMHAKITVGDCRQAAATAARVRGHLHGGQG